MKFCVGAPCTCTPCVCGHYEDVHGPDCRAVNPGDWSCECDEYKPKIEHRDAKKMEATRVPVRRAWLEGHIAGLAEGRAVRDELFAMVEQLADWLECEREDHEATVAAEHGPGPCRRPLVVITDARALLARVTP